MKEFLKNKGMGFYFGAVSVTFAIAAIISYTIAGQDGYGFVPTVDAFLALGVIVGMVFLYRDFMRIGPMVITAFFGTAFGIFIYSRFMYYSHQFYGIASDPITGAMIACSVTFAGALIFGMISAFVRWEKEDC